MEFLFESITGRIILFSGLYVSFTAIMDPEHLVTVISVLCMTVPIVLTAIAIIDGF